MALAATAQERESLPMAVKIAQALWTLIAGVLIEDDALRIMSLPKLLTQQSSEFDFRGSISSRCWACFTDLMGPDASLKYFAGSGKGPLLDQDCKW